jgi:hypothetical protein
MSDQHNLSSLISQLVVANNSDVCESFCAGFLEASVGGVAAGVA